LQQRSLETRAFSVRLRIAIASTPEIAQVVPRI